MSVSFVFIISPYKTRKTGIKKRIFSQLCSLVTLPSRTCVFTFCTHGHLLVNFALSVVGICLNCEAFPLPLVCNWYTTWFRDCSFRTAILIDLQRRIALSVRRPMFQSAGVRTGRSIFCHFFLLRFCGLDKPLSVFEFVLPLPTSYLP